MFEIDKGLVDHDLWRTKPGKLRTRRGLQNSSKAENGGTNLGDKNAGGAASLPEAAKTS